MFNIEATMKGYKVLGVRTGTSKAGKTFKSIDVYRDGKTAEISCSDPELFYSVDMLGEMDVANFDVRAVSGRERSYITLVGAPVIVQQFGA